MLVTCCAQNIRYVETEDKGRELFFTPELKALQQWDVVYILFDGNCLQRKLVSKDSSGEVISYYYEYSPRKHINFKYSTYRNFDDYERKKQMIKKTVNASNVSDDNYIDLQFILENGLEETFNVLKKKNIFIIDKSLNNESDVLFQAFEVQMISRF